MSLLRSSAGRRASCLLSLLLLLVGVMPPVAARAQQGEGESRQFIAEPLPPVAFEPTIIASDVTGLVAPAAELSGAHAPAPPAGLAIDFPAMPGIVAVRRSLAAGDDGLNWDVEVVYPDEQQRDFTISIPEEFALELGITRSFTVKIDGRDVPIGAARSATIVLTSKLDQHDYGDDGFTRWYRIRPGHQGRQGGRAGEQLSIPVSFVRAQAVVRVATSCEPAEIVRGAHTECAVTLTNTGAAAAEVALLTNLPRQLRIVRESVTGGRSVGRDRIIYHGAIAGRAGSGVSAVLDPSGGPVGYVSLDLLGIEPISGVGDETISNVAVPEFSFAGERYTRIGIVSNGYLVLGGGDAGDITPINTRLPTADRPNGTLAPFWSNLDPGAGGAIRVATVTDGVNRWLVVDYNAVPNSGQPAELNSFQVWISRDVPDTISFVYGREVTAGAGGLLTVGAESGDGSTGATVYYNGEGAPPGPGLPTGSYSVAVTAAPGEPASHTVRFTALANSQGEYVGYSYVISNVFDGIAVDRFAGKVLKGQSEP